MARDLAIDLGTANTLVYVRGEGIVLNEPSVIALNNQSQDVLAVGTEAWQMIGRTPGHIVAVRPLRAGAITDFEITQRLIRLIFERSGVNRLQRARVLVCVPSGITHVEQRAVLEATRRAAGVRRVGCGRHGRWRSPTARASLRRVRTRTRWSSPSSRPRRPRVSMPCRCASTAGPMAGCCG